MELFAPINEFPGANNRITTEIWYRTITAIFLIDNITLFDYIKPR
jgi:hypothetical protein